MAVAASGRFECLLYNLTVLILFSVACLAGGRRHGLSAAPLPVVLVLVAPFEVALRASATASGRYGGRIKHLDKECHVHVGQLVAVNLPVAELLVDEVEYRLWNIKTLFRSFMGKRVGYRAGMVIDVIEAAAGL